MSKHPSYATGLGHGISIALGYFSVSFSFGILATKGGIGAFPAALISLTNMTSAGQFAGLESMVAGSSILVMILTQIVINFRYTLMSLSLSQKLGDNVKTLQRLCIAFFNTDEIFAVAMGQPGALTLPYMMGLATLPWIGWTLGTLVGAVAGSILPVAISSALGVALYAMFIAIVAPTAETSKAVRTTVIVSAALSCLIYTLPMLKDYSIILCTVIAAAIAAKLFPVKEVD